ncbi:MAG: hypothetical protein JOZ53_19630 [Planctomycetaceae bacterium]|nr:hypothetical protein [Planctomycetaceae bacterium]
MSTPSRVRRPRPARGAPSSRLILMINQTLYEIRPLACDSTIAEKAYRLDKEDGSVYDVSQTRHGPLCDCPDFVFRRDGLDPSGCKHVKALLAHGLIEGHRADVAAARG